LLGFFREGGYTGGVQGTANVAVLLFDDVEVLDFCGPFEVFSVTEVPNRPPPFHVFTCAESTRPVWTSNQLSLNPQFPIHNCPAPDILVVPGGWGTREQMNNPRLIGWIASTAPRARMVLSVCTGALLLAKAGLLDGLSATTHHDSLDLLHETAPTAHLRPGERFVDNGQIVVAAGISAGIDAALHVVTRLLGHAAAERAAQYMEYDWRTEPKVHRAKVQEAVLSPHP
jgi:transcriptional regulator GlxA family with amidase domain